MKTPETGKDTNVLRKTPDEIKKGLMCYRGKHPFAIGNCPSGCPYEKYGTSCRDMMNTDALAIIRQLQYALLLMISQYCTEPDEATVTHRFMSAGEHAFEVLGIKSSHISTDELETMIECLEKEMHP